MCLRNIVLMVLVTINATVVGNKLKYTSAFDNDLYERVLDPMKCEEQLDYLTKNLLVAMQFIDASGKIPNGILIGNLADLGNYHQCLNIRHLTDNLSIEGKYCMINIPLNQNIGVGSIASPTFPAMNYLWPTLENKTIENIERFVKVKEQAQLRLGVRDPTIFRAISSTSASTLAISLGICVPKACRPKQIIDILNYTNLTYNENFCRLPNDKPISIADYVAISIFSLILLITIISTSYDLYQVYVLEKENSEISIVYRCFSIHTNTKRFLSFNNPPGALECVDGIRAISMLWVIIGHTYFMTAFSFLTNASEMLNWLSSFKSVWVNSTPISVDTFFTLSGILCVYTVIGKISRCQFIKSLHLFYLHRLLRIFPLLAALILLQTSVLHRVSDGPVWTNVASTTESCRKRWWSTLLHIQNYVKPIDVCLLHTWYLSVDIQLYIISPIVIIWLFGSTAVAWCSLAAAILISFATSSTYSFLYNFSGAVLNPSRMDQAEDYLATYYMNTLTRASPFFIGMMYGYLLHKLRGQKLNLRKSLVTVMWIIALAMMAFCIFSIYPIMQVDHDAQMFDNFLNAYMRGIWAMTLGWLIFACVHGYGGPINWFLSLQMWKIPARLSYTMYLIHFPIILIANGSMTSTYYFSDANIIYCGMGNLIFTIMAAFVLCIVVDAPFSTIQKLLLEKGTRKPDKKIKTESQLNNMEKTENENKRYN